MALPKDYAGHASHSENHYGQNGVFDTQMGAAISSFIHYDADFGDKDTFLKVVHEALQKEEVVVPFINDLQTKDNKEESVNIYLKSALKEMILASLDVVDAKEVSRKLKLFGLLHVDMPNKESCGLSAYFQIGCNYQLSHDCTILEDPEDRWTGCAKHGDVKWAKFCVISLISSDPCTTFPLELLQEGKVTPTKAASIMLGFKDLKNKSMVAVFNQKILKAFAKKHQVSTKPNDNQCQKILSLSPENE